jgi:hypothetical protein
LDKDKKLKKKFLGGLLRVLFAWGKERKRRMSLSRWWKEGEWVECLKYFKKIEVSRIVLGA